MSQVLSDGTNKYLYGNGRIAQASAEGTQYFLGDALGSVRQLADAGGVVSLAKGYDPFGNASWSAGSTQTPFGYTSEQTDANGLVYLRARYYAPGNGRFVSKDVWQGDYSQPITLNSWLYVKANPIIYSDPSGFIYENEAEDAQETLNTLKTFNVNIKVDWGEVSSNYWFNDPVNGMNSGIRTTCDWLGGVWSLNELYIIQGAIKNIDTAMKHKMSKIIGPITISKSPFACGRGCTIGRNIDLLDSGNLPTENPNTDLTDYYVAFRAGGVPYTNFDQWTVAHEIGHVWNGTRNGLLSMGLVKYTGGSFGFTFGCDKNPANPGCNKWLYRYGDIPATGSNDNFNPLEDFAESVAAYVFPNEAQRIVQKEYAGNKYLYYPDYTNTLRWNFINWLVDHSN